MNRDSMKPADTPYVSELIERYEEVLYLREQLQRAESRRTNGCQQTGSYEPSLVTRTLQRPPKVRPTDGNPSC